MVGAFKLVPNLDQTNIALMVMRGKISVLAGIQSDEATEILLSL